MLGAAPASHSFAKRKMPKYERNTSNARLYMPIHSAHMWPTVPALHVPLKLSVPKKCEHLQPTLPHTLKRQNWHQRYRKNTAREASKNCGTKNKVAVTAFSQNVGKDIVANPFSCSAFDPDTLKSFCYGLMSDISASARRDLWEITPISESGVRIYVCHS